MNSKDIIKKTLEDIENDRRELLDLYKKITKTSEGDIFQTIAAAENLVKISDALAKKGAQMIELAKMKQKEELASKGKKSDSEGLDHDDIKGLYNEMEESFEN